MKYGLFFLLIIISLVNKSQAESSLPILKDGRWKIIVTPDAALNSLVGETEVYFCTAKNTQAQLIDSVLRKGDCGRATVSGAYRVDAVCSILGKPTRTTTKLNFTSENRFSGQSLLKNDAMQLSATHQASFLGPCLKGEKPGSYTYSMEKPALDIPMIENLRDLLNP